MSAVFGAFQLVEREYQLGVEVRGLDGRRTDEATIYVQNEDFVVFAGSYNEYNQWLTDAEIPAGNYTITLYTPVNTYAVLDDSTQQYATATDRENVFTIEINDANLGNGSSIYGTFQLVERDYQLGVEVRDLNNQHTSDVSIEITDADGEVFSGTFNDYNQWRTDADLPAGEYTITLTTPEGTIAEINDTVASQRAIATDVDNVFTIQIKEENLAGLSRIFAAFRLVEEDIVPVDPTDLEVPVAPEVPTLPETPGEETPDSEVPVDVEDPSTPEVSDDKPEATVSESTTLPKTGIAGSTIGLGIATVLSGLGLFAVSKKRKED